jgi:hypothetical protein
VSRRVARRAASSEGTLLAQFFLLASVSSFTAL